MATASTTRAAQRIQKAVKEQKQQRTIVRPSRRTRKALAEKGVKAARRKPRRRITTRRFGARGPANP